MIHYVVDPPSKILRRRIIRPCNKTWQVIRGIMLIDVLQYLCPWILAVQVQVMVEMSIEICSERSLYFSEVKAGENAILIDVTPDCHPHGHRVSVNVLTFAWEQKQAMSDLNVMLDEDARPVCHLLLPPSPSRRIPWW